MATILVEILGNAKQFKHELDSAVASTEKANSGFSKMGGVATIAGAALVTGVAVGLTKSVEAAIEGQKATARLNAAFAASHVSAKQFAGSIEEAEAKSRKLGFTNDQVRGSLGSLIVATHNGHKAISDLSIAQDIARFKGVSLETATKTLTMAMAGSQRATKQLGIDVPKVTTAQDAMATSGFKLKEKILEQEGVVAKLTDAHDKSAAGIKRLRDAQETLNVEQTRAKEVNLSHTSEIYKHELAHAKLVDRLSTENTVIATVSEKLHGQAAAYSDTAAGAMAAFHASINDLEERIGTALLPALTQFTKWLTAEIPPAIEQAKAIIKELTPTFESIVAAVKQVIDFVRDHWSEIRTIIKGEFEQIAGAFNLIGDVLHGRWSQIWDDIKQILEGKLEVLKGTVELFGPLLLSALEALGKLAVKGLVAGLQALPGALEAALSALPGLAFDAAKLIGEAIVRGVKWAAPHIAGLAGELIGKIGDAITQVTVWALGEAEHIGVAIKDGVVSGIQGLGGAVKDAITGAVGSGFSAAKGALGIHSPSTVAADEIGKPIGEGVIEGWLVSSAALPTKMTQSLQNAITAGRAVIQTAQASFQTSWSQIASDADKAFSGIKGAAKTPAEKELAAAQAGHEKAGRDKALADAQAALDTANAGGDPAAILAAQAQVDEAKYQIHIAALQKTAEAQRVDRDAEIALQQRHFDEALTKLQTHLEKGHSTYAEAHAAILKLFKSFGVNYAAAGRSLGVAFVTELKESIKEAAGKGGDLSTTLDHVASGIHVPHAATGGFVSQTGLAVIHQGETITPAGGGGGVTVIVNGWVGNDQDIAEKIRNVLIRTGRTTSGGALGGFA